MAIFKRIDHVALEVKDLDFSINFYKEHFGFEDHYRQVTPSGIQIAYLKLGDTQLELVGRHDQIIGGFHWCMETDDFDGAVSQLKEKQVKLLTPPHPTDAREPREKGWRRVVFKGPDGEQIELRG
jgi:lactoylglutathione lyase